jgi:hypothetical protein
VEALYCRIIHLGILIVPRPPHVYISVPPEHNYHTFDGVAWRTDNCFPCGPTKQSRSSTDPFRRVLPSGERIIYPELD